MKLIYSDGADGDGFALPAGHRFPAEKYTRIRAALAVDHADRMLLAPRVEWGDLETVHAPEYVAAVRDGALGEGELRRLGFPWSERLANRSRRSVGGTLMALEWALAHGAAGHLAGGTHHAFRDRGEGFCVFNDLAVATAVAQRDHGVGRVAIVDLDVHQGNGTAALCAGREDVFTLSLHGARNYPFVKAYSTLDVALPDGCDDDAYLHALDQALSHVRAFDPGLILYQAGVDALVGDRFGRLALTHTGLQARDQRVFDLARALRVPLVVTLGGGYGRDVEATVRAHVNVFEGLMASTG